MQCANRSILAGVGRRLSKGLLGTSSQRPKTLPSILPLCRGMASKGKSDCVEQEAMERMGIICRKPDLRRKPIPPYKYGFCREPDRPMMMSCPPKGKKGANGPCCYDEGPRSKGGCKRSK